MTKDEFDSIEEGDEAELGHQGFLSLKGSKSGGWEDTGENYTLNHNNYSMWGRLKKAAPTNASDGWYMEAGEQFELRSMTNAAGFHAHGEDGKKLFDISYGQAVQYIQRGIWVKQPTPGKLFGVDETRQYSYPVKVKRPEKAPPKISDYPHRCDCGSPAFAGILTVDCQAKCSKPNVRNV